MSAGMTLFLVRRNTENQHNPMPHTAASALKALAKGSAAVWTNFQNFLRARKGSITPCSLWSWQTELCLPGSGHDQAALRIVARNCMFLSVAEAEQCWVWEGYSLTGSLTVHIPVLPARYGTLLHWQVLQSGLAGTQESVSRHILTFLGQQL